MKFEFADEVKRFADGRRCTRIRALIDIPKHGVKAGDLGGFLEFNHNLSQAGSCWVAGECKVSGDAVLIGDSFLGGHILATHSATMSGSSHITGRGIIFGHSKVWGNAIIESQDIKLCGNATIASGHYQISPFYLTTTYYDLNFITPQWLRIGCQYRIPSDWLAFFEHDSFKKRYYEWEVRELKQAVEYAIDWRQNIYMCQPAIKEHGCNGLCDPVKAPSIALNPNISLLIMGQTRANNSYSKGLEPVEADLQDMQTLGEVEGAKKLAG